MWDFTIGRMFNKSKFFNTDRNRRKREKRYWFLLLRMWIKLLITLTTIVTADRKFVLAVCLQNGYVFLLKTFDDVSPVQINTELKGCLCIEWSNSRELLAVAGTNYDTKSIGVQSEYTNNILKFYNEKGVLIYSVVVPFCEVSIVVQLWY